MSKCPFWSTAKMKVECYKECPMYATSSDDEKCPFKEHLDGQPINLKGIIEEDFAYSKENDEYDFDLMGSSSEI